MFTELALSNSAMTAVGAVEVFLWAALAFLFREKGFYHRFRTSCALIELRAVTSPLLWGIVRVGATTSGAEHHLRNIHFAFCFTTYIAYTVLVFFAGIEVFRSAFAAFPGIAKLAIVLFRWAAAVSVIESLTSISNASLASLDLVRVSFGVVRSVSTLELCVLTFVCLCMKALRLPAPNMGFGIALCLGILSMSDLVFASCIVQVASINALMQFIGDSLVFAGIGLWITYCVLPEPAPKMKLMPANSMIYRWNEIATALGHTGTRVVVHEPGEGCFMSHVERVVEEALARNLSRPD